MYANLIAASNRRSRSSLRTLRSSLLQCGSQFPLCPSGQESSWMGNQERRFCLLSSAFKRKSQSPSNRNDFPPSFTNLLGPWCSSLHTRVSASRCSWSAPGLPPPDWWRVTCILWYSYSTDELFDGCVHIAVYTAQHLFM